MTILGKRFIVAGSIVCSFFMSGFNVSHGQTPTGQKAQLVANLGNYQATGVTVSAKGRVFLSFPRWEGQYQYAVVSLDKQGENITSYPNKQWNTWKPGDDPRHHFVCVQSVYAQGNTLWVLDPASPKMAGVVANGPKLVAVNLTTNQVERVIPFNKTIAPQKSYLNDLRIDSATQTAYITDSGLGGIVVLNLRNGQAYRTLDKDSSVLSQPGYQLEVNGRALMKDGNPPKINSDGIALDTRRHVLYYHALTGDALYAIPTAALNNKKLSAAQRSAQIKKVTDTGAADGLLMGPDGQLIVTHIQDNTLQSLNLNTKQTTVLSSDPQISWPDTMSIGPGRMLYLTNSQLQNAPLLNNGVNKRTSPYKLLRFKI